MSPSTKANSNSSRKLAALAIGIVCSLTLAEASLWYLGRFQRNRIDPATETKEGSVILCLGNSHTLGAGAPPGHSFPDSLQRLIDVARLSSPVRVVNGGLSNANSTLILERLEQELDRTGADIVVLMTGEPNHWNKYHLNRFLAKSSKRSTPWGVLINSVHDGLYAFRTFRLANILWNGTQAQVEAKTRFSAAFPDIPVHDHRILAWRWIGALENSALFNVRTLTPEAMREAKVALEALLADEPSGPRVALGFLARIHAFAAHDFAKALEYYERTLQSEPAVFHFDVYRELTEEIPALLRGRPELEDKNRRLIGVAKKNYPGDQIYRRLQDWFRSDTIPAGDDPVGFLQLAHRVRPTNIRASRALAWEFEKRRKIPEAAQAIMAGIRGNPLSPEVDLYPMLRTYLANPALPELRASIEKFVGEMEKNFPDESYFGTSLADSQLADWVRSDIEEMGAILERRHVKLVLQTYAPTRGGGERVADRVSRELAHSLGVPLVDNHRAFLGLPERDRYYSNAYGPLDNHLNAEGYQVMARLLFEVLRVRRLIPA